MRLQIAQKFTGRLSEAAVPPETFIVCPLGSFQSWKYSLDFPRNEPDFETYSDNSILDAT